MRKRSEPAVVHPATQCAGCGHRFGRHEYDEFGVRMSCGFVTRSYGFGMTHKLVTMEFPCNCEDFTPSKESEE